MTTGSLECDWDNIDDEPTDPNRFKSTREVFEAYLGTMLDNMDQLANAFSSREALDRCVFESEEEAVGRVEQQEGIAAVVPMDEVESSESAAEEDQEPMQAQSPQPSSSLAPDAYIQIHDSDSAISDAVDDEALLAMVDEVIESCQGTGRCSRGC